MAEKILGGTLSLGELDWLDCFWLLWNYDEAQGGGEGRGEMAMSSH